MQYIIYPDLLFLENMLCNLLFLSFMKRLFFPAATWKKIFLAGTMTALCNTLVSVLFFRCIWILKIGVLMPASGLMVCSCLQIKDRRRIFYLFYQMILWTFALGGIFQALQQWAGDWTLGVLLSAAALVIIFGMMEKVMKRYRRQNACMRDVTLYLKGKCCHIRGFADTGNQLVDPYNKKPVSIVSKELWSQLTERSEQPQYKLIPYQTVGREHGLIPAVQIDYMVIREGKNSKIYEQPMIAMTEQPFTGLFHYSILLHSDYC